MKLKWLIVGLVVMSLSVVVNTIKQKNATKNRTLNSGDIESELKILISKGNKIEAIKLYREYTGYGLKEAKEHIDYLSKNL
ncbi:MAG: 50S ribosomal protein L7/L12 [Clostridiales bacterium]|nr:50S ribosomal protein L7/L12 [Clostridiales bacterium]